MSPTSNNAYQYVDLIAMTLHLTRPPGKSTHARSIPACRPVELLSHPHHRTLLITPDISQIVEQPQIARRTAQIHRRNDALQLSACNL